MGDHGPALPVITRFGKLLREAGERYPVNGQPPRGVGDRPYPARVGPAAEGVATNPDEVGGVLDPVRRHYVTLTQIRLQSMFTVASAQFTWRNRCICTLPDPSSPARSHGCGPGHGQPRGQLLLGPPADGYG